MLLLERVSKACHASKIRYTILYYNIFKDTMRLIIFKDRRRFMLNIHGLFSPLVTCSLKINYIYTQI